MSDRLSDGAEQVRPRRFLPAQPVDSLEQKREGSLSGGFEYSLEMTAKAHVAGHRIAEVPSIWRDRTASQSWFHLLKWLPYYLKWYVYALSRGRALTGSSR